MWIRLLHSGQTVPYDGLPFQEVVALATALDEWEMLVRERQGL